MEQRHLSANIPSVSKEAPTDLSLPQNRTETEKETIQQKAAARVLKTLLQKEMLRSTEDRVIAVFGIIAFLVLMLAITMRGSPVKLSQVECALLMIGYVGVLRWGMWLLAGGLTARRTRSLLAAVSRIDQRSQVGLLIKTLEVRNTQVRTAVIPKLVEILPTLRPKEADLLGSEERMILWRQLQKSPDAMRQKICWGLFARPSYRHEVDLRVAVLKMLEQLGDTDGRELAEQLAGDFSALETGIKVPGELRAAAKAYLLYVKKQDAAEHASTQLLRGASHPVSHNSLLRPAANDSKTPPKQLLRPANPED